jgi:ribosome-binding ATPase YchF (GTP1/OBG family)
MLVGIVGKANVGKSTFFKAATLADTLIANYPFATIKPNHGTGYVKVECAEKFFNVKCNPRFGYCVNGIRFVPIDMLDVAGLVPGAHEGKGMGNQFLDDLRQADVLVHVVDMAGSTNENGNPITPGTYDPANDIKFLEEELDFWYLGILNKGWSRFARETQQLHREIHKELAKQLSGLGVNETMVEDVIKKHQLMQKELIKWDESDLFKIAQELRKMTKPMIVACNKMDIPVAMQNFERIKIQEKNRILIPCSGESELALREASKHGLIEYVPGEGDFKIKDESKMSDAQKKALNFIKESVLKKFGNTGVQQVLDKSVFELLKYIPIFPGGINKLADSEGRVLPDCFLLPKDSTALDFAFKIHTDLGKNFIRAIDVKTRRTVGKEHLLKPGDVVEIVADK